MAKKWLITIFPRRNCLTLLSDENARYMHKKEEEEKKETVEIEPRRNFATRSRHLLISSYTRFASKWTKLTKWSEENEKSGEHRHFFSNQRFVRVAITLLLTLSKLICFILLPGIRPSVRTLADHRTKFSRAIRVPVCTLLPHKNRYAVKGFSESWYLRHLYFSRFPRRFIEWRFNFIRKCIIIKKKIYFV